MKTKSYLFYLLMVSGFLLNPLLGQQAVTAGGASASGSGGSVSYSVGQTDYTSLSGSSGTSSQGVQQPHEIYSVKTEYNTNPASLSVYPNPTASNVTINTSGSTGEVFTYQLMDVTGKVLITQSVNESQTVVPMAGLPPASYILVVTGSKQSFKSFKIIKSN